MAKNARVRALGFARQWLGVQGKLYEVAVAAADALEEKRPIFKPAQWAILLRFHEEFRHAKPPTFAKAPKKQRGRYEVSDGFLLSYEWRKLRMVVLKKRGARCECCGASPKDGIVIHVDHIKPRRKYPDLALMEGNLQVLCEVCNHGKGAWDETDWRPDSQMSAESLESPVSGTGDGDGQKQPEANRLRPRLIKRA